MPAYVPKDWLHVKIGCGSVCSTLQRSPRYNSPTVSARLILSEAHAYVSKDWLRLKTGHKSCKSAEIPKIQFLDSLRRFAVVQFSEPPRVQFPDNLRIIDYQYRLRPLRLPTSIRIGYAYDGVTIDIYQTSHCSPRGSIPRRQCDADFKIETDASSRLFSKNIRQNASHRFMTATADRQAPIAVR